EKLAEVGWEFSESDSFAQEQLKSLLFASAVGAGHKDALAYVDKVFAASIAGDKHAIHPNVRASVFNSVAKRGDAKVFEQLYAIYQNSPRLKRRLRL
ncbi:hypothetical protein OXX79_014124, partial [Metschnikowia pulcherrima]